MGLAQSALILLGIGIVSSRFKAGVGLGQLGTGISTLVAAPLTGTGTGLSAFAGGVRDIAEVLGDLGRGFSALFGAIPKLPPPGPVLPVDPFPPPLLPIDPPRINGTPYVPPQTRSLITNVASDTAAGGGTRVPQPVIIGPVISQPVVTNGFTSLPGFTQPPSDDPVRIYSRNKDIMMI